MKIRTRSRLILVATLVVFLIVLSFITQSVILQSFGVIEEQETTSHVQRFISQINNEIEDVAATCRDWANRDETAAIFTNPNGEQDSSRIFQPVSMKNLGIDYIIIYDTSGHRVFAETISKEGDAVKDAPIAIDTIVHNSIITEGIHGGISGRRGISSINNDPVILAGYPIMYGNSSNSSEGTLVMVRLLDSGRIGDIDRMLQLDGTLVTYDPKNAGGELSIEEQGKAKDGAIVVRPVNENELDGLAIITGIENKPSFLLMKIETTRPVYQEVKKSILIAAAAIIILSIIFPARCPASPPEIYSGPAERP